MRLIQLLAFGLMLSSLSLAQTTVTFWDFFGGGDGVRMKQIVDDFNKSQKDIVVNRTTLTWGAPFYTKIHTSVVAGETPDLITYHLSALPRGLSNKDLRPITAAELKSVGLAASDFQSNIVQEELSIAKQQAGNDQLYAIPLDTHTSVLYYNKNLLKKAGVLGSDGKPMGLDNAADFAKTLLTIKQKANVLPMSFSSAQDSATIWRMWYSLLLQQNGSLAKDGKLSLSDLDTKGKVALQAMVDWSKQGLLSRNTTYPASVALFTSGRAAFMFNGNWEVPTMVDLKKNGKLPFDYGIVSFPKLYANADTWADSHTLAIPNNTKTPMSAAKLQAVLKFVAYVEKTGGLTWAGGGHIPAYLPTQESAAYKQLEPNAEYSATSAADATHEPTVLIFGVGGPVYDAVGNDFTPALLGQVSVDQAIAKFKSTLQSLNTK
ncbi:MAG: extracellular solute-binding protein [Thermaceae bacterium]|nr:extracellular solute-binding protein [Thermaceae bacterium]